MAERRRPAWTRGNRIVGFDPVRRRLWVGGQRLHHGATGIALAATALAQLLSGRPHPSRGVAALLAGSALAAHDWKDRSVWFQAGEQDPN